MTTGSFIPEVERALRQPTTTIDSAATLSTACVRLRRASKGGPGRIGSNAVSPVGIAGLRSPDSSWKMMIGGFPNLFAKEWLRPKQVAWWILIPPSPSHIRPTREVSVPPTHAFWRSFEELSPKRAEATLYQPSKSRVGLLDAAVAEMGGNVVSIHGDVSKLAQLDRFVC